ncbi:MAG TPA: cytochrome d ubiquinol oxidase subunit II [Solirubrobacteraceae bacterium]|jgi:cytochrome d ubiquinol oxidase subunit II|nr:cytochrome d ubiquinol oxidase subunit II [Solirubrobacteraceae bacterium]
MLQALPLAFCLAGLTFYTVLGGADFGAGFWQLFAGRGPHAEEVREHAHHSMAPVWEANHVWLIFVITVFWTAYPTAFGSIFTTLSLPLFIAAVGIIMRGAAYALRSGTDKPVELRSIDMLFSISSLLTPFALGACVGAIASERVPAGNAIGDRFSSWLNPTSILVGVLAVATSSYLAAVYLAADATRSGDPALERAFRARALGSGLLTGAIAVGGLAVLHSDAHSLYHQLVAGDAVITLIVSILAGSATLALVFERRFEAARYSAALAVAAIIAGWALARWPTLLPGLSVQQAAAPHDTLVALVVAVLAGAAILFPSLALLFRLALTGRFDTTLAAPKISTGELLSASMPKLNARVAGACLIAGVGLLNVAEASWAHALGVLSLFAFIVLGFLALVPGALADAGAQPQPPGGRHPADPGR